MTEFGWDASDYDWSRGPMDVAAAARDGIVFFTHKATEGTWIRHLHLADALDRARAAAVEFIGAYHVVRTGDVDAQVRYYLAYLDEVVPWWRTFPGFFHEVDLEKWSYDQVSAATGVAFAIALRAAQPKPVVTYASRGQYSDSLTADPTPLWNANYGTNPTMHYREAYPGDDSPRWGPYSGHTPAFLQYGSQLVIGSQPGCDANAFRGSLSELRALIRGGTTMVSWTDPQMPQRLGNPDVFANADPVLADLFSVLNCRGSVYVTNAVVKPPLGAQLDRIEAATAGALKQVAALAAVIQQLTASGTSIDTAAVLAAVKAVGDQESAALDAANGHIAALQAALEQLRAAAAVAAQAQAAALATPSA